MNLIMDRKPFKATGQRGLTFMIDHVTLEAVQPFNEADPSAPIAKAAVAKRSAS